MPNYSKTIVMGNVGRDPEMRFTTDGKAICNFSIAYSEKSKGQDYTTWYRVTCFDKTAEVAGEYVKKGNPVMVEGRIREREWTDKEGTKRTTWELLCDRLVLLGGRADGERQAAPEKPAARGKPAGAMSEMDSDVPFAPIDRRMLYII